MERKRTYLASEGQKMSAKHFYKLLPLLLIILFTLIPNPNTFSQTCHAKPQAIGGFLIDTICKTVTVTVVSQCALIPNNICIGTVFTVDWGDGSATEQYISGVTGPSLDPPYLGTPYFIHHYPTQSVGGYKDSCLYLPIMRVTNVGYGTDQLTGIINGWDKEHKTKAIAEQFQICRGASGTFTFHDATVFNCLTPRFPGLPNDTMRTEKWEYGIAPTTTMTTANITINGSVVGFPDDDVAGRYRTATSGHGSSSIFVPTTSTSLLSDVGKQFFVRLNIWNYCNPYPGQPAEQVTSYIIVVDRPGPVTITPKVFCQGDVLTPLSVTGAPLAVFHWWSDSLESKLLGTGANYLSKLPNDLSLGPDSFYYVSQQVAGFAGCESKPIVDSVHIYPTLNPGVLNVYHGICKGTVAPTLVDSIAPSGGTGVYTYQWQSCATLNGVYVNIGGATSSSYAPGAINSTTYYQRKIFSGPCSAVSNKVTIIVTPTLVPGRIAGNQNICQGTASVVFTQSLAPSGGTGTFAYQWYQTTDSTVVPSIDSLITGAISPTYLAPTQQFTRYFTRKVTSGYCQANSYFTTIRVTPTLHPGVITGSANLCQGQTAAAFISASDATGGRGLGTYTYTWQSAAALTGPYGGSLGAGTGFGPVTPATSIFYRRRVVSDQCTSYSDSLSVIVTPTLVAPAIAANQNICSGSTPAGFTSTLPTGGLGGYAYQWYSSPDNVTYTAIVGATSQTYSEGPLGVTTWYKDSVVSQYCRITSNTLKVTVTPTLLPGTIAGNANICQGQTPPPFTCPVSESGGNGLGTYTYQWQSATVNGGPYANIALATGATYSAPALSVTTYYVRKVFSGFCTSVGNQITVTVTPTLNAGTVGNDQTLCSPGNPSTFNELSAASGGNGAGTYAYQWKDSISGGAFNVIGGAIANSYTSPGGLVADRFFIRVVSSGFCTIRSNVIKVIIQPTTTPGSVTIAAPSTICALVGIPGSMTEVTTAGGGTGVYTYQWLSGTVSGFHPSVIAGANGTTFNQPAGLTVTTYFVRQVTSGVCPAVISNEIAVTVQPTLTAGVIGSNQALCGLTVPAPLTELASPNGGSGVYTYLWKSAPGSNGPWTNIAVAGTSSTYAPPALASTTYYKRAVNSGVCPTDTTNRVDIIITGAAPGPAGAITGPAAVCSGDQKTYSIAIVAGAATYGWAIPAGASIVGPSVNNSVIINFTGASSGNVVVTPLNGCGAGAPSSLAVTVNPVPVVTPVVDISACPVVDPIAVHFTSTVGGSVFNWTNSNTVIGILANGIGDILSYPAPINNSGSVISGNLSVTATANACTSNPVTFKINVKPTPVVNAQGNLIICPGDVVAPSAFSSNTTGETYAWTNDNAAIGLTSPGPVAGNINPYTAPGNATPSNIVGNISVLATLNSCVSSAMNFSITVKPKPVVTVPANIIVCPGDSILPAIFTSTVAGATFNWTNNNTTIGIAASGTGNIAHYVAPANNSSFNITGTITLTATANSCTSVPVTFTITIKPTPVITSIGNISVCPTNTINPGNFVANTGGGTAFSWTNNNASIGLPLGPTAGNIASYAAPENLTSVSFDGLITVLGTINACVSAPMTFHIIVKSRPTLTAEANIRKCPTENIAPAAFASNMGATTYAWTNTNTSNGLGGSGSGSIGLYAAPANVTGVVQSGTITVTGTSASCVSDPITFLIQVKPTPVLVAESNITVCPGASISPAAFNSNVSPNDTFNWTNTNIAIGLAASGTGVIPSYGAPVNVSGADFLGTISVKSTLESCLSSAINFTITVHPTPVFTSVQPPISVCPGSAVSPNVFTTSPPGSTFSWTNDNGAIGLGLSGSGSIALYTSPANITGAAFVGNISVTATKNTCPSAPFNFTITVKPKPVVTAQVNITVCPGQAVSPAAFSANTGGGETFSWTNPNPAVGLPAGTFPGNIASYSAPANNTGSVITSTISVTATLNGCTSAPMTFTINIRPTPVINAIANIAVCPGASVAPGAFSSNTVGETYSWTNDNAAIGLPLGPTAGNIATYSAPANLTGSAFLGNIAVTATLNTCVSLPMNFSITINPKPVVSAVSNIVVCPGASVNPGAFVSNAGGSTFNWTNNNTNIGLLAAGSGNIVAYAAPANLTSFDIVGTISVTATANGCTSAPVTFTVTIKPTPVITALSDISVCPFATISPPGFTANTGALTAFTWTNSNPSNGLATPGAGNITAYAAPENLTGASFNGLISVTATINGCVSSAPMTFHIIVKSRPTVVGQADIIKCPTQLISPPAFTNNMGGTTYSWINSNAGIGLVISGSGNISAYAAPTNVSGTVQTGVIKVTGTNTSCVSDTMSFQIQVKPTPVITPQANISVCPTFSIAPANFTSNTIGETYAWTNSNTQIGLPASGLGNISSYPGPANVTGSDFVGTIAVQATLNSCLSSFMNFTITDKRTPVITAQTDISVCPGTAVSPASFIVSNVAGSNFNWTNDNATIGLGLSGVGNIIPYAAPGNVTGAAFNGNISVLANANGCISSPMNFIITVKPQPIVTAQANITVCAAQNISPAVFSANTGGGESFNWTNSNLAIGLGANGATNISSYVAPANNTGSVISGTISVTATKNGCISAPMTFTINIKPTPVITAQSDIVVCKGETIGATFHSNTVGETYAWTNTNPIGIGLPSPGSGNIIPYAAPDNLTGANVTGNISVTATLNTCASLPMTFHITIKPTPLITHNASISVCPGSLISPLPFATTPAGATFSWSNSNINNGLAPTGISDIPPYTAPSNLTGADINGKIIVSAVLIGCQAVPDTFNITDKAQPVVNQLTDIAVCPGSLISVPVFSSNAPGSSFTWTNNNPAIGLAFPGPFAGNIGAYVAPSNATLSDYKGKITVTGTRNSCSSTPMIFNISVHPTPQTSPIVGSPQECLLGIDIFSVTYHANSVYVWTLPGTVSIYDPLGDGSGGGGTANGGHSDDNFARIQFNASGNQTISVTETSGITGCVGATQNYTILVNPKPIILAITGKTDVCLNDVGIPYSVPNHVGSIYQWTVPPGANVMGVPTLNNITVNYSSSGGYLYARETSQAGCVGDPDSILITMHPIPNDSTSTTFQTICNNSRTSFNIYTSTVPTAGIRFDYNIVTSSGLTAYPSSRTNLVNGGLVSDSMANTSNSQKAAIYFITPRSPFCNGPSSNVTIAVQPKPKVTPSVTSKTICNDQPVNVVLTTVTSPSTSVTFDYTVSATGGVTNALPATGVSPGSQILDALHNPTNSIQHVTYKIVPKAFGCIGDTVVVTVTVAPTPSVISTPVSQTICDATATNLKLTTATLPKDSASFSFTAISTGGITGITPSANGLKDSYVIADILSNATDFQQTVTYTITPKAYGCLGTPINDTVTVNPQPKVSISPPTQTICSGVRTNVSLTTPTNPSTNVKFGYTVIATGGVTGFSTPVFNLSNNSKILDSLINNSTAVQTVTYTVTPTSGACTGTPSTAVITVNPIPVVIASNPFGTSVCSDNNTNIVLTTPIIPVTSVSFNYTASATLSIVTGFTNSVTGLTNGSIIFDYLHNTPSSNAAQVTYLITPKIGACTGNQISVVINIKPKPTLVVSVPSQAICNKTRTNFSDSTTSIPPDSIRFSYHVNSTGSVTGYNTAPIILGLLNHASIKDSLVNSSNSPQVVSYVMRPYSVGTLGCQGDSTVVPVTVYPTPVVNPSVNSQTICSSSLTNINLQTPTSPTGSVTFDYTSTSGGGVSGFNSAIGVSNNTTISDQLINTTTLPPSPQTVTYSITPKANGCVGLLKTVIVTVNPVAKVTAVGPYTICNNTNTNIPLATTTLPAGKVRFNYTTTPTGGIIPPTVSDTGLAAGYIIIQNLSNPTQFPQSVTYHVTPVFAYTCAGTTFDVVVTVNPTPDVTPHAGLTSICNITATNISLTTQSNPQSAITFNYTSQLGVITGHTSNNGLLNNSTIADVLTNPTQQIQTIDYTITPFMGVCVGPSKIVTISVKPTPVVISTPAGRTICDNVADSFKLTTTTLPVDSVRFDYTALSSGGVTGYATSQVTNLLNNAVINDVLRNPNNTPQTATYTITPRIFGCSGSPLNVVITVNPIPVVTPSTLTQTICSGAKTDIALLTPTFPTAAVTFNYTATTSDSTTGFSTPVNGKTNNWKIQDPLVNASSSPTTVTYNIIPQASGCTGSAVNVVVTVNPTPIVTAAVLKSTICDQTSTHIVLHSPTKPAAGVTFDYNVSTLGSVFGYSTGITGLPIGSIIADPLQNFTNTFQNVTYQIKPNAAGCTGTTLNVVIRLNPTPIIASPVQIKETCYGALTSLSVGTVNTPKDSVYFDYTSSPAAGIFGAGNRSGVKVGSSGYIISESLSNTNNFKAAVVYTLTPKMYGCIGSPITLIDSVQPQPNVSSSKLRQTICDKTSTNFALTTTIIPASMVSFSYNATNTGSISGYAPRNSGLSNKDTIKDLLFNLGNKPDSVTYVITPATSLCTGTNITVRVVVNPTPRLTITPLNSTICSGSITNIKLTTTTAPTAQIRFNYTVSSTGGISGYLPLTNPRLNNAIIANTLVNDSLLAEKLTYTITPSSLAGCVGDPLQASVTVNPFPTINAGPDDTICSDGLPFLNATAGGSYTSVDWYGGAGSYSNPTSLSTIYYPNVLSEAGKTITLHVKTSDATGICTSVSDSLRLIIKKKPTVTASSVVSICEKLNVPVSAIATGNFNKVRWSVVSSNLPLGGRFIDSTKLNTTYIPLPGETGITTLKVTVSDTLGYCSDVSSTVAITINPLPLLNVQNSAINNQVCFGDPITFTATNALFYKFIVNGVTKQDSSLTTKFTYVPVNSDKVWVRGTSAQGCSNYSDTTTIKVNSLPIIHLTSSDANNIVCKSDLVTFTAVGATNYKFFVGAPPEVQALSASNTYLTNGLAVGSNSIYAQGVDTNLCKNFSDTIVTIVRDLPTAIIVSKDSAFCNNYGVNVMPLSIKLTGVGPWTITWTDDAGTTLHTIDSIQTNSYTFNVHPTALTTTYRLWTVREHNGADCPGTVKPASMTVTLWELPTAQIDPKPDSLIAGKAQLFQAFTFGGTGTYPSYVWSGDSSLLDNPLTNNVNFTANLNGLYHLYLQVTDTRGCIGRDTVNLKVVISKIIIKLAWDSVEVCAGLPLQLNGILLGDIVGGTGTYISYRWKGDTTVLSKSYVRRPTFTSNTPGSYKYAFEVTDNIGTKGRDSVTVIVLQNPSIHFIADTIYSCSLDTTGRSDTITLSGNPTGGTGVYSYKWTNQVNNLSSDIIGEPQFHSLAQAKYALTYLVTDSKGCSATKNIVVTNEAPIAYFVQANPGCSPVVANYVITPNNTVRYAWNFNDGSAVIHTPALTISHSFINDTIFYKTYNVTLTGYSLHGCQSTLLNPITIYPKPATDFTATPDSICSGSRVQFIAVPGAPIHKWDFGSGENLGGIVNQNVFTNSSLSDTIYKVKLVVISFDNCSDTIVKTILVHPMPVADFDISPFKIQYPDTVFNIVNNSPIPQYKYDWTYIEVSDGINTTQTIMNPLSHAFHDWGVKTIRLRAYSDYCQDTMRRDLIIDPPKPIAKFITDKIKGCLPLTITFTNQSSYYRNVEWYFGDGGGSKDVSPTYTYDFPGDYKVTLIAKGDGGRDTLAGYDVTVYEMVKAWFGLAPKVVIVPTTVVNFQNMSENGSKYVWDFGDGDTSQAFNPKHQYQQEGIFDVTLSAWSKDGCFDSYTMSEAVTAKADVKFISPNAFIPDINGEPDGKMSDAELRGNDVLFRPAMLGVVPEGYTLQIFNRWGEILFETHDLNEGWTGYYKHRLCPQDVYVWKVVYKSSTGQRFEKEGTITLYR